MAMPLRHGLSQEPGSFTTEIRVQALKLPFRLAQTILGS